MNNIQKLTTNFSRNRFLTTFYFDIWENMRSFALLLEHNSTIHSRLYKARDYKCKNNQKY